MSVQINQCRFCGATKPLIKAHVIPEAFFRPLRVDGETPLVVSNMPGVFPKKAPIGIYDKELLCESCEVKFSPTDSFGVDILLTRFDQHFTSVQHESHTIAYEASTVDKVRLLEFLVSILWRASASGQAFFKTVRLGAHEPVAKNALFASPTLIPPLFDAVLSRWSEANHNEKPTTGLLNPHRERWDGVNAYRFYLGAVLAYVKVDRRPFIEPLASQSLQSPGPCRLILRELQGSNDIMAMRKTIITAEANRQALRTHHLKRRNRT
jgi:hypothetical protein